MPTVKIELLIGKDRQTLIKIRDFVTDPLFRPSLINSSQWIAHESERSGDLC